MKRKIIVAIICSVIGTYLGLASGVAQPLVDAAYCLALPDDCK